MGCNTSVDISGSSMGKLLRKFTTPQHFPKIHLFTLDKQASGRTTAFSAAVSPSEVFSDTIKAQTGQPFSGCPVFSFSGGLVRQPRRFRLFCFMQMQDL